MRSERVLAATDLSDAADEALRQAHELASGVKGALAVCHVVPSEVYIHPLFPERSREEAFASPGWREKAAEIVRARVQKVTGRAAESFEVLIEVGSAAPCIVSAAEAWKADRIVVSSVGATGLARLAVGGVSLSVARHAHCPVQVARPRSGTGRIVVGTDFSDPAFPAVTAAADESRRTGGKVTIVHVVDLPIVATDIFAGTAGDWPTSYGSFRSSQESAAREKLAEILTRAKLEGDRKVLAGPPAACIVNVAEETGADLIVVGTRGRTGLRRMVLGSVAEAVVRAAHCSVLVVRLAAD